MFIINTPMIFKAIWAFVNPMLEDRTRKKIQVSARLDPGSLGGSGLLPVFKV